MTSRDHTSNPGDEAARPEIVATPAVRGARPSLMTRLRKWWLRRISRRSQVHALLLDVVSDPQSYPELRRHLFETLLPRMLEKRDQRAAVLAALRPVVTDLFDSIVASPEERTPWIRAQLHNKQFLRELLVAWGEDDRARQRLMRIGLPAFLLDESAREAFLDHLVVVLDQRSLFGEVVRVLAAHPERLHKNLDATADTHGLAVYVAAENHHYVPTLYGKNAHKLTPLDELPEFGALARAAIESDRTLLYYDRLHTLYQALISAIRTFGETPPLRAIEVGVFRGGGLGFLASVLEARGVQSRVDGFDTFEGHHVEDLPEEGVEGKHRLGLFQDTSLESTQEHVARWPFVSVHQGRFEDRCDQLGEGPIHFAHLDVDIYAPTVHGLAFLHQRMPVGGIIVVDDYGFTSCPGARRAVDEFLDDHSQYTHLPQITGQSLLVRIAP